MIRSLVGCQTCLVSVGCPISEGRQENGARGGNGVGGEWAWIGWNGREKDSVPEDSVGS